VRLRTDDWWTAGRKRAVSLGAVPDPRTDPASYSPEYINDLNDETFEEAKPGDCWRIVWVPGQSHTTTVRPIEGASLAGYVLTCPSDICEQGAHGWDRASNCSTKSGQWCAHEDVGSCWPEDGTLSATPSLFAKGAKCEWHGFVTSGVMT
jgi:hypothetical protein